MVGVDEGLFLLMAEFFDFAFTPHRVAPCVVGFYIGEFLGFMRFGVSCAFAGFVLTCSRFYVFGVAGVEAAVTAK